MAQSRPKTIGAIVELLLPSVKMKSLSPRGVPFERELHEYLLTHFDGYTVASGSITGYWAKGPDGEQCNEHLQYRIAVPSAKDRNRMERHIAHLPVISPVSDSVSRSHLATHQPHVFCLCISRQVIHKLFQPGPIRLRQRCFQGMSERTFQATLPALAPVVQISSTPS